MRTQRGDVASKGTKGGDREKSGKKSGKTGAVGKRDRGKSILGTAFRKGPKKEGGRVDVTRKALRKKTSERLAKSRTRISGEVVPEKRGKSIGRRKGVSPAIAKIQIDGIQAGAKREGQQHDQEVEGEKREKEGGVISRG